MFESCVGMDILVCSLTLGLMAIFYYSLLLSEQPPPNKLNEHQDHSKVSDNNNIGNGDGEKGKYGESSFENRRPKHNEKKKANRKKICDSESEIRRAVDNTQQKLMKRLLTEQFDFEQQMMLDRDNRAKVDQHTNTEDDTVQSTDEKLEEKVKQLIQQNNHLQMNLSCVQDQLTTTSRYAEQRLADLQAQLDLALAENAQLERTLTDQQMVIRMALARIVPTARTVDLIFQKKGGEGEDGSVRINFCQEHKKTLVKFAERGVL